MVIEIDNDPGLVTKGRTIICLEGRDPIFFKTNNFLCVVVCVNNFFRAVTSCRQFFFGVQTVALVGYLCIELKTKHVLFLFGDVHINHHTIMLIECLKRMIF